MLPVTNKNGRAEAAAEARAARNASKAEGTGELRRHRLSRIVGSFSRAHAADRDVRPLGAAAERQLREVSPGARVAEQLIEQCAGDVVLLHHRRTPRVKPHIDHLAVGASGVWIIHSRRSQGRVATRKPMFGDPKLTIGGRERTDLLMNLERQVSYVEGVLARDHADIPVRSALCFVDTEAPLLRTLYLGSYLFFGALAVAQHLNSDGPLNPGRIQAVAALLEAQFPPA